MEKHIKGPGWDKLGEPARKQGRKAVDPRADPGVFSEASGFVDFTVGGSNHLDIQLHGPGSSDQICLVGLTVDPEGAAKVAFQLKMERGQAESLISVLSSWLKFSKRKEGSS